MFQKVKRNFIMLNMIIISSVMFLAFGSIFLVTRQNTISKLKEDLNRITFNTGTPTTYDDYAFEGILPADYQLSFQIIMNHRLEITGIKSYIDMPISAYQEAAQKVIQENKPEGMLKFYNRTWFYKINPENLTISYLDASEELHSLNRLGIAFLTVGVMMLFVIYLISVYFANRATKQLEHAWNIQKNFIANASHELKTPLAILNVNADALKLQKENQWVENIQSEIQNMNVLITNLLDLAKSEQDTPYFENVNLSALIHMNLSVFEVKFYEAKIQLHESIDEHIFVKSDSSKLNQMIRIFLDNALKYADKAVSVSLKRSSKQVELIFKNDGETLTEKEQSQIFDRFYKKDPSRSEHKASYGLGLSIARALSESLNHPLEVRSGKEGTIFKIIFKI